MNSGRAKAWRVSLGCVAAGALAITALVVPATADATEREQAVVRWIDRSAAPLATTDPRAPLGDLAPLRQVVGAATVVGLGEATHGSHEQFQVKHRMARYLVENMGFRTIAMEHDFAQGVELDRYVMTGQGDPRELVRNMGFPFYLCDEILDLITWMRSYNTTHQQKVRFLGTDITALRDVSFDEVTRYVRQIAPDRLERLRTLLAELRPKPGQNWVEWYQSQQPGERKQLIATAREASELVRDVPETAPRLEREYAEQHARAILGWYEAFDYAEFGPPREVFIADTIGWWQRAIGGKVAYWAANVHMTKSPSVTYRHPQGGWTGKTAGGYLHERLGRRYVAIGSVFHSGTISSDYTNASTHPISAPPPGLLDTTLGKAQRPDYLVNLHAPAPRPVRDWRAGPVSKRMILPSYAEDNDGSAYVMSVPSLGGAFDALVHIRTTTASHLFGQR